MKLNQLSIFLGRNQPGSLNAACKILAEAEINLSTLTLADTKDFGILRIIVEDWEKARDLLTAKGFMVKVTDVVAVRVENRPGGMCAILDALEKNGINVEYMYAFVASVDGGAVVIFRFDSPDEAVEKLKANGCGGISFVAPEDIFHADR